MKLKKGIILQEMGDTFVAYDNETSTIHELNGSAYFILSKIKDGKEKGDIIKMIVGEFGVSENEAQSDFDSFVAELRNRKLVEA